VKKFRKKKNEISREKEDGRDNGGTRIMGKESFDIMYSRRCMRELRYKLKSVTDKTAAAINCTAGVIVGESTRGVFREEGTQGDQG